MSDGEHQPTVLVVDDDPDWGSQISEAVADARCLPKWMMTIEDAQQWINEGGRAALIVLDVLFGEALDPRGIDFARWLKGREELRDIPLIFCSVVSREEIGHRLKKLRTGKDCIVDKPFDSTQFSNTIAAILKQETP